MNDYISIDKKYQIRLNSNESYIDMDNNIMLEIKSNLSNIDLHRYPENSMLEIRELYAKYSGTEAENIIVGNGSDEMLQLIISSLMGKGKKMLTMDPDFVMYDFYVSLFGGEIKKYKVNNISEFNLDEFIDYGKKHNVDLIMFSNPNNPTGLALSVKEIVRILETFQDKIIVVDEAYYEFYGESMIHYINEYKNLIVTRTLSKAWGLAALRVGFLIGNTSILEYLSHKKIPYTVNSYSQAMALIALKYPERVIKNVNQIIKQRELLFKELKNIEKNASMDIKFYSSKGNFIMGSTSHKKALLDGLNDKGILIRNFQNDTFRITVGSPLENKKVIEGIKDIFIYQGGE
ncbi:histidinol-phosphate transaminase [Clostridium weizhouense]|uniref:Histidinol-phosphate transaminase n=1 Tax=Clostridium weizhouense TaxID=2859781 RepID=A0ABS7AKI7_9CLOT|nr:histidinol-phosphate transaminase [Clostridium weizhouense]MBW6409180.1 histidinol-phosphate transaminase [Clostridium weizhouense]